MEGKRGSECLLKSVSNIDFNPGTIGEGFGTTTRSALSGVVDQLKPGYKGNMAQLIQGAFWCKGINPGSELNQDFSVET
ncbi:MAG: hypothetical protein ACRDCT_28600, partial [Shewanella sp.]